jgi:hypothetical protein
VFTGVSLGFEILGADGMSMSPFTNRASELLISHD